MKVYEENKEKKIIIWTYSSYYTQTGRGLIWCPCVNITMLILFVYEMHMVIIIISMGWVDQLIIDNPLK